MARRPAPAGRIGTDARIQVRSRSTSHLHSRVSAVHYAARAAKCHSEVLSQAPPAFTSPSVCGYHFSKTSAYGVG